MFDIKIALYLQLSLLYAEIRTCNRHINSEIIFTIINLKYDILNA